MWRLEKIPVARREMRLLRLLLQFDLALSVAKQEVVVGQ
jgi:hypothetical protein